MSNTALHSENDQQIRRQLEQLSALNAAHQRQVLQYSKAMLDKLCPLASGSHSQVQSYVVYYQNLLAFFADGQSAGLADPAQFVALCGSKEQPQSLLLKAGERHIELTFCRGAACEGKDVAGIEDIQLQLSGQQWFSLVRGASANTSKTCRSGHSYRGRSGDDYQLS